MSDVYALAMSPDKLYLVVKRGDEYAIISRKDGITETTEWRNKSALSQMVTKADYKRLKTPVKYNGPRVKEEEKVEKGRKSVGRLDEDNGKTDKDKQTIKDLGLENFHDQLTGKKIAKADNKHLPIGSERFTYKTPTNYGVVFIPTNRLKMVYQTDDSISSTKVNENVRKMKEGVTLQPVEIGYNYDVHDGHHRWKACEKIGYTHVPCKVVGTDPNKVKEAINEYKKMWKSDSNDLKIVLDLSKSKGRGLAFHGSNEKRSSADPSSKGAMPKGSGSKGSSNPPSSGGGGLNYSRLVKKPVQVRGKDGKVYTRMQWVLPHEVQGGEKGKGPEESTFTHHEDGLKDLEKRQSNRFPVLHHPTKDLKFIEHNYSGNKEELAELEAKYKRGEKLPPVKINPSGQVLEGHSLVDLGKKYDLSHIPVIVVGNPTLKKKLEDKLRGKPVEENTPSIKEGKEKGKGSLSSDVIQDLEQFEFTKKKYTKVYLMQEAERQGIEWKKTTKSGDPLPSNSAILWMNAHMAIVNHIKEGNSFEVNHVEGNVDERMTQDGKDSIHKHFLKLRERYKTKDEFMEWAKDRGILWKENRDPSINWKNCVVAVKTELAKGKMIDGVRTRQKDAMKEANTVITDQIKDMVKAYGKKYGKEEVMKHAESLGIEFSRNTKKGEPLPSNSNILWMRASEAVSKFIAQGGDFKMGKDEAQGISSVTGDYGEDVTITPVQGVALDKAKRNSRNKEPKLKKWALKAIAIDMGVGESEAEDIYNTLMEKAREKPMMIHIDPMEVLPNGTLLLEQITSDNKLLNDFQLNRGIDRDHREINERDMFGDEFDDATDNERPVYGVVDLMGLGLGSNPFGGEMSFVLNDNVRKRTTGSAIDSNNIPYGQEGNWVRSMEDPHHLIIDRWRSRWKKVNKPDAQRKRMFESVLKGTPNHDDNQMYETHVMGGIDMSKDVSHILVPSDWETNPEHADKFTLVGMVADQFGLTIKTDRG